jgi:hypothetical protein
MFADVGVEVNVTPPVGRDWLADALGAPWAVWVAGLGAYTATRASTPVTATSDAAAIRSRGVKRTGILPGILLSLLFIADLAPLPGRLTMSAVRLQYASRKYASRMGTAATGVIVRN